MGKPPPLSKLKGWDSFWRRLQQEVAPSHVLLFGSRASGRHLQSSDVDLVIVSVAFEGIPWIARLIKVTALWEGDVALEPLCYTPAEYAKRSRQVSIVREAARTGVALPL